MSHNQFSTIQFNLELMLTNSCPAALRLRQGEAAHHRPLCEKFLTLNTNSLACSSNGCMQEKYHFAHIAHILKFI